MRNTPSEGEVLRRMAKRTSASVGWTPRPEVAWFAGEMERQLRANDHKPGWKQDAPNPLMERLRQEAEELEAAIVEFAVDRAFGKTPDLEGVVREAADVANFAMMIADVCRQAEPGILVES